MKNVFEKEKAKAIRNAERKMLEDAFWTGFAEELYTKNVDKTIIDQFIESFKDILVGAVLGGIVMTIIPGNEFIKKFCGNTVMYGTYIYLYFGDAIKAGFKRRDEMKKHIAEWSMDDVQIVTEEG